MNERDESLTTVSHLTRAHNVIYFVDFYTAPEQNSLKFHYLR